MGWTVKNSEGQTLCKACNYSIRIQPVCEVPEHYNVYLKYASSKQKRIFLNKFLANRKRHSELVEAYLKIAYLKGDFTDTGIHTAIYWMKYFTPERFNFYRFKGYPAVAVNDVIHMSEFKGELSKSDLIQINYGDYKGKPNCYEKIYHALEYLVINKYVIKSLLRPGRYVYSISGSNQIALEVN